jgi:tRNA/tmRNA/rRNA uracil-C5-methylase (TrmA/RlmC/RlmD family)
MLRIDRGSTRVALDSWPAADGERVILDPPRMGAGRDVVEAIAKRRPASVTYVSCDPATLARDAATFHDLGFAMAGLVGFDLFPETFHIEAVARLLAQATESEATVPSRSREGADTGGPEGRADP